MTSHIPDHSPRRCRLSMYLPGLMALLTLLLVLPGCGDSASGKKAGAGSKDNTLTVPDDLARLAEHAELSLEAVDQQTLRLNVVSVSAPVTLVIAAGTSLVASPADAGPPLIVRQAVTLDLEPGQTPKPVTVKVLSSEVEKFGVVKAQTQYVFHDQGLDHRLTHYLKSIESRELDWPLAQAGAWVVVNNATLRQLQNAHKAIPGMPPLGAYSQVRQIETLLGEVFEEMPPFRLFRDSSDDLARFLRLIDPNQPGIGYDRTLIEGAALQYKGESQVEQLLIRHMIENDRTELRLAALNNLVQMGLSNTGDELLAIAIDPKQPRHLRFLASRQLVQSDRPEAMPLLALFEHDPELGPLFVDDLTKRLVKSDTPRQKNEDLYAYWERAVGWRTLGKQYRDVAKVREAVDAFKPLEAVDQRLARALSNLWTDRIPLINDSIDQIKKHYANHPNAFRSLESIAKDHYLKAVRIEAINALQMFPEHDVKTVLRGLVEHDEDEDVQLAALNLAEAMKFDGYGEVFVKGLTSSKVKTRAYAIGKLTMNRVNEAEPLILEMARNDSNDTVKQTAIQALCIWQSPDALALLEPSLAGEDANARTRAIRRILTHFRGNAKAKQMLEPFKDDPQFREQIAAFLQTPTL